MGECQLGETIDSIGESMVKPAVTTGHSLFKGVEGTKACSCAYHVQ